MYPRSEGTIKSALSVRHSDITLTARLFFLISCMKTCNDNTEKLTEPNFRKKISFGIFGPKMPHNEGFFDFSQKFVVCFFTVSQDSLANLVSASSINQRYVTSNPPLVILYFFCFFFLFGIKITHFWKVKTLKFFTDYFCNKITCFILSTN